jgi:ectoine hydroxylase-related dioxygenase (phytanoyl-CoA dioxygenase family)
MTSLLRDGYQVHRGVFSSAEIEDFRAESDGIATKAGSACVRRLIERSRLFGKLSASSRLLSLFPESKLLPIRSILFDKTPDENWPVAWHQDLTICVTEKLGCEGYGPWSVKDSIPHVQPPVALLRQMVTARIHLDPTNADNGALMILPGSHLHGKLASESIAQLTNESSITCECQPGDVLLMHPLILHSSKRSARPNRRRILHFEYAPPDALDSRLTWHETPSSIRVD